MLVRTCRFDSLSYATSLCHTYIHCTIFFTAASTLCFSGSVQGLSAAHHWQGALSPFTGLSNMNIRCLSLVILLFILSLYCYLGFVELLYITYDSVFISTPISTFGCRLCIFSQKCLRYEVRIGCVIFNVRD